MMIKETLLKHILEEMKPLDVTRISESHSKKIIVTCKTKANHPTHFKMVYKVMMRTCIKPLLEYLGKPNQEKVEENLMVPELINFIVDRNNSIASDRFSSKVLLLLGSPIIQSDNPLFSLQGGKVFSDGHIFSNNISLYSTEHIKGSLDGFLVMWLFPHEKYFLNFKHRFALKRAWGLWVQSLGGKMAIFSSDYESYANLNIKTGVPFIKANQLDSKIQLHDYSVVEIPKNLFSKIKQTPPPPQRLHGKMEIGILWGADLGSFDIDLHVRHKSYPKELSYRFTESEWGKFGKDIRTSHGSWEQIKVNVDTKLDELKAYVNLFSGYIPTGKKLKVDVRLSLNNVVYSKIIYLTQKRSRVLIDFADVVGIN